ncbi:hypothetical protein CSUI_006986 [Cystoisospora suis]|uniref:Uncharacterized protein n=1 Tax=Cystoisospora suis TaxID=483139 RepID=A0A2C6KRZ4_9APIC|nr:hypothetical protein CSUI_006986 [Cystoisospora suis]
MSQLMQLEGLGQPLQNTLQQVPRLVSVTNTTSVPAPVEEKPIATSLPRREDMDSRSHEAAPPSDSEASSVPPEATVRSESAGLQRKESSSSRDRNRSQSDPSTLADNSTEQRSPRKEAGHSGTGADMSSKDAVLPGDPLATISRPEDETTSTANVIDGFSESGAGRATDAKNKEIVREEGQGPGLAISGLRSFLENLRGFLEKLPVSPNVANTTAALVGSDAALKGPIPVNEFRPSHEWRLLPDEIGKQDSGPTDVGHTVHEPHHDLQLLHSSRKRHDAAAKATAIRRCASTSKPAPVHSVEMDICPSADEAFLLLQKLTPNGDTVRVDFSRALQGGEQQRLASEPPPCVFWRQGCVLCGCFSGQVLCSPYCVLGPAAFGAQQSPDRDRPEDIESAAGDGGDSPVCCLMEGREAKQLPGLFGSLPAALRSVSYGLWDDGVQARKRKKRSSAAELFKEEQGTSAEVELAAMPEELAGKAEELASAPQDFAGENGKLESTTQDSEGEARSNVETKVEPGVHTPQTLTPSLSDGQKDSRHHDAKDGTSLAADETSSSPLSPHSQQSFPRNDGPVNQLPELAAQRGGGNKVVEAAVAAAVQHLVTAQPSMRTVIEAAMRAGIEAAAVPVGAKTPASSQAPDTAQESQQALPVEDRKGEDARQSSQENLGEPRAASSESGSEPAAARSPYEEELMAAIERQPAALGLLRTALASSGPRANIGRPASDVQSTSPGNDATVGQGAEANLPASDLDRLRATLQQEVPHILAQLSSASETVSDSGAQNRGVPVGSELLLGTGNRDGPNNDQLGPLPNSDFTSAEIPASQARANSAGLISGPPPQLGSQIQVATGVAPHEAGSGRRGEQYTGPPLRCPQDCEIYFDGCTTCRCFDGGAVCRHRICTQTVSPSSCLKNRPSQPVVLTDCPAGCAQTFDGCNLCSCNAAGQHIFCRNICSIQPHRQSARISQLRCVQRGF